MNTITYTKTTDADGISTSIITKVINESKCAAQDKFVSNAVVTHTDGSKHMLLQLSGGGLPNTRRVWDDETEDYITVSTDERLTLKVGTVGIDCGRLGYTELSASKEELLELADKLTKMLNNIPSA